MKASVIQDIIYKVGELTGPPGELAGFRKKVKTDYEYTREELNSFIYDLTDEGRHIHIAFTNNTIAVANLSAFLDSITFPVILFTETYPGDIEPALVYRNESDALEVISYPSGTVKVYPGAALLLSNVQLYLLPEEQTSSQQTQLITSFPIKYYSQTLGQENPESEKKSPPSPLQRLLRLLNTEKKDIWYIYVYAIVVGLISLVLPLGTQAIIGMISGGMFFSSVVVLISIIIVGVLVSGGLQIMQVTLVEVLQQRIFARAAFEFAFRVPKIKPEAFASYYPPELMNRFFDVVVIQKSLPKILVDLSGAVLQIFFGIILLAFYHPAFLAFGMLFLSFLFLMFRFTGPKGLETSLSESKYKYKIAAWLEEIARTFPSFRLAGDSNLHIDRMDDYVNNYLYYRKSHFSILKNQYIYIVIFKTLIIGALLILGSILVVDNQITLGQFVASEVVVVLVVGAVEKIIFNMENVYDLLTATEKVGTVTDLPLEKDKGSKIKFNQYTKGVHIKLDNVQYKYPESTRYALQNINLEVKPGERIGIAGTFAAGRHTLANLLAGSINTAFEGSITINSMSMRDIQASAWRVAVDSNLFSYDIFDGSIQENISMNRARIKQEDIWWAIEHTGLSSYVNKLPEGIDTKVSALGTKLTRSTRHKLILARCIASRPKLLIFNDDMQDMQRAERLQLISFLIQKDNPWTLLAITNDTSFLSQCDKVVLMDESRIVEQGTYAELAEHPVLKEVTITNIA
ncbi:ATP-binding cassette domain-containing protein [Rhodocytophaga aerolata]|uniref:ATP-binding cassette domain-containing protein n=1 Tax=Rhodocytophaga aerolata TaxID=455078 RepID=A0ABT8QY64_9BACT|nr:ATP-binding cassette domain-containing protein [Rhodocytophaga aerolata]MDO1444783.1 ATP-binding cassette domain-containing protein [Rhodocytophaga aerolata]